MSAKSIPLSVRIAPEDAEFIAGLQLEGARTPSDKVRALIADARRRAGEAGDYPSALALSGDLIDPALRQVREAEHRHERHSELLIRIGEWLPETVAFLRASASASTEPGGAEALLQLERGMVRRVATLAETVLQMGVTEKCPCYDGEVLNNHIKRVLDLADLILSTQQRNKERSS
jgi:hypothetical protein